MSRESWGVTPPKRIRCCFHTGKLYWWHKEAMNIPVSCRLPAVVARIWYPYKNGNSTRPYPLCEKHRKGKGWHWHRADKKPVRTKEIPLTDYVKWLQGKVKIGYRRLKPGSVPKKGSE